VTGTAIIFGSAGGIGRALAEQISATRRHSQIYAGSRKCAEDCDPAWVPFSFDLLNEESVAAAVGGVEGSIELALVTTGILHDRNANISPEKSIRAIDPVVMAKVFAINAIGPALIAKHIVPRLVRDRRAVVAFLSAKVGSISDNRLGGWYGYRASKAALNMILVNLAIELKRTHPLAIVVALHPGTVATGLSEPFQRNVAQGKLFTPEESAAHLLRVIDGLTPSESGGFFAWNGEKLTW
jgi:NAD(P)-dependent dehydrogenase (short-subunit alcohol dehydrogenase family)